MNHHIIFNYGIGSVTCKSLQEVHTWFVVCVLAEAVKFISPLKDTNTPEGPTITFECEVSKLGVSVTWFRNGKKILKSDKRASLSSDGTKHFLTIKECILSDTAEYSAKIPEDETVGKLTVTGQSMAWIQHKTQKDWLVCISVSLMCFSLCMGSQDFSRNHKQEVSPMPFWHLTYPSVLFRMVFLFLEQPMEDVLQISIRFSHQSFHCEWA